MTEIVHEQAEKGHGIEMSHEHIEQALNSWANFIRFRKTEITGFLDAMPYKTVGLFSGNQAGKCITITTKVSTPMGEIFMGDLYNDNKPFEVYAWDGKQKVIATAFAPFKKAGLHKCYEIGLDNGQIIQLADKHRVLSSRGWINVEQIHADFPDLFQSNSGTVRKVHPRGVHHLNQKRSDCQDDCSACFYQYGEQLLSDRDSGQVFLPLKAYARQHIFSLLQTDGLAHKHIYNLLKKLRHLSSLDVRGRIADPFFEFLCRFAGIVSQYVGLSIRLVPIPTGGFCHQLQSNCGFGQSASLSAFFLSCSLYDLLCKHDRFEFLTNSVVLRSNRVTSYQSLPNDEFGQHQISCDSPCFGLLGENKVEYIRPITRKQEVFDFEVKKYHNYFAGGLIHHNTSGVAYHYVKRLMGIHPVKEKNRICKKVRCMSSSLPESDSPEEQDNTQYLELKKLIPPGMIQKDITARGKNLVVLRPVGLSSDKTVFEFRSSKQEMQDLGKIQLSSVWHDEETPKGHREECKMRLLAESGDEVFSLTPTNALSYTFDEIWNRASYIARTTKIAEKFGLPLEEYPNKGTGIGCLQMATDDNPTLDPDTIERLFEDITDPDELAIRRYGVFKQISGRIHKSYDSAVCYISGEKWFPDGVPYGWLHVRGVDYHESRTPWSIGWLSASPEDEWFLWQEFHPAIDGANAYNTYDIAKAILRKSGDYYYNLNLIDPLANKKQANTLFSTTDDLNRYFDEIHRDTGIGTGGYWSGWDTKGVGGRDEVGKRFKNSVRCGRPFNNLVKERGRTRRLPTLWVLDCCPKFNKSLINWRFGEYVTGQTKAVNDPKPTPQQKWSHDCMVLECLAKDHRLLHAADLIRNPPHQAIRKNRSLTGR